MVENSLQKLAAKVQWLANNNKIGPGQLQEYNFIIQDIQNDFNACLKIIDEYSNGLIRQQNQIINIYKTIHKLEAIALLHGINDLPVWMDKHYELIANLLVSSKLEGWSQLPYKFRHNFNFNDNLYQIHPDNGAIKNTTD